MKKDAAGRGFRNGTESRDLLPLWLGSERSSCFRRPVDEVHSAGGFRNGTELRDLLPLWTVK